MGNVTITSESYRSATYLDSSIVYNTYTTISGIGLAVSGTITIDDADLDFENGDLVYINYVEGTTELNDRSFTITSGTLVSGTTQYTYYLKENDEYVDTSEYTAWTSGGTVSRWATTISGLEHLEGLSVTTIAEGAILANQAVISGTITLPVAIKYGIIGLGYDAYLTTMPLEVGNEIGASIGRQKKIADVYVRLYKSVGMSIGPNDESTDEVSFRTSDDDMDKAIPLFSGDRRVLFPKGFAGTQTICVKSAIGLPLTVLAVVPAQYVAAK